MANIINVGGGAGTGWKLLSTVTGSTAVTIPNDAVELYIIGHANSGAAGYDVLNMHTIIITACLSAIDIKITSGFNNGLMLIQANNTSLTVKSFVIDGHEYVSNISLRVYYK